MVDNDIQSKHFFERHLDLMGELSVKEYSIHDSLEELFDNIKNSFDI
jgi:hypothetical protein